MKYIFALSRLIWLRSSDGTKIEAIAGALYFWLLFKLPLKTIESSPWWS
jgi:hypothetical protein